MDKTQDIFVDKTEERFAEALRVADEFIGSQDLAKKRALHLRIHIRA